MKITKIEIKHFRGFPGPCTYTFDLAGKNLLLYGENGSGKSSLYHALDQLFNADDERPFTANLFGRNAGEPAQEITDGHVTVHLDGPPPISLRWDQNGDKPTTDPVLISAAMRKGFLEYRSLLRTNFVEGRLEERLFHLAAEVLMARIPVSLPGGTERLVGEYWKDIPTGPVRHYAGELLALEEAINRFNDALKAVLPKVEEKATELLAHFTDHHLKLHLEFDGLAYDKAERAVLNQELRLRVEFNDIVVESHESLLNEARLSALALALYLASVLLSNPAPGPSVTSPLKLLVLDDVLIGLDLSNRLPLLEILEKHFGDYQVILSTYDRVWFDLARLQIEGTGRWTSAELFSERIGAPGYDVPRLKSSRDYIQQAKEHLASHDYRAAAVYARAAFEAKLKKFCEAKALAVKYHRDPRRISSEDLWQVAAKAKKKDGTSYVDTTTRAKIQAIRKVVLNPLSHDDMNSVTRAEVDAAIKAVEEVDL